MVKKRIFLLVRGMGIIADNGQGAWQFQLGGFWFVKFSSDFIQEYSTKYGVRFSKNSQPWFFQED